MKEALQYCSFCGRSSKEVGKMVGSTINDNVICESCIMTCYNMIVDDIKGKLEDIEKEYFEKEQKIQDELRKSRREIENRTTEFINELNRAFGRAEQTQIEATKILKKLQTNLGKPEMLERAKEQLEIAIDMLNDQKQDKNSQK